MDKVKKEDLQEAFYAIGLRSGDVVFVHSANDNLAALGIPPVHVMESLFAVVGERGTIAMPTFPQERLFYYLKEGRDLGQHPVFDCRKTISYSGLLTELFRRLPESERSLHPTHSVAVCGPGARSIIANHHRSREPFDRLSPFQRLLEHNVRIVRIGQPQQGAMTFRHLADHMFQQHIPFPIYSTKTAQVHVIDKHGKQIPVTTKVLNCDISCNHLDLIDVLIDQGLMVATNIAGVPLSLTHAETYINAYQYYYKQGFIRHYPRSNVESEITTPTSSATGNEIGQRLRMILAEQANNGLRESDIDETLSLYGKGIALDSVGIVSLIARLENEFGIFLETEEISHSLNNFGALHRVIQNKLGYH